MFEKVINILKKYRYGIAYTPYHTDEDIKKYSDKKDKVNPEEFLTILTEEKYVVGRLHDFKKGMEFSLEHLQKIISYFEMFEIKHNKEITEELKKVADFYKV